jgi:hypothetical protein
MTGLQAMWQRREEEARASEGVRGQILGGEPDGQAQERQDVPRNGAGAKTPSPRPRGRSLTSAPGGRSRRRPVVP